VPRAILLEGGEVLPQIERSAHAGDAPQHLVSEAARGNTAPCNYRVVCCHHHMPSHFRAMFMITSTKRLIAAIQEATLLANDNRGIYETLTDIESRLTSKKLSKTSQK